MTYIQRKNGQTLLPPPAVERNDYTGMTLYGYDFSNKDLSGYNFSHCDLRGSSFVGSNLLGATFYNSTFSFNAFGVGYDPPALTADNRCMRCDETTYLIGGYPVPSSQPPQLSILPAKRPQLVLVKQ